MPKEIIMTGIYAEKGEYHRYLSPNDSYYPTYQAKMKLVREYVQSIPKNWAILDAGCGEGILVEQFKKEGYSIIGLDLNYASDVVVQGDITQMPFKDNHFNLVLCLDTIEHLHYSNQEKALAEISRVLKRNGILLISIPNLAHILCRLYFLLTGKLARTSSIQEHPGDRPIAEYIDLLIKKGFAIVKRKGVFPTLPISYLLTTRYPARTLWLFRFINLFAYPNFCFLNIFICRKKAREAGHK
ncbi:methyltransferase domain-containing protein [Patescibacteria group bacterium]|nr:methyltransferase domain-containing protein [Patescibacteria group bacterium]